MDTNPNRKIPLLILSVIAVLAIVILFLSLDDKQKQNFTNIFNFEQEEPETEEPVKEVHTIEEIFNLANNEMLNKEYLYCKVYVEKVAYNNNKNNWGFNFIDKIYMSKENDYIDYNEKLHYFVNNGVWFKEPIDSDPTIILKDYTIPITAKQIDDDRIDGALCYVFYDESTNKYFYIKQSTETIAYIKETIGEVNYIYSFSNAKVSIDHKVKRSALEK